MKDLTGRIQYVTVNNDLFDRRTADMLISLFLNDKDDEETLANLLNNNKLIKINEKENKEMTIDMKEIVEKLIDEKIENLADLKAENEKLKNDLQALMEENEAALDYIDDLEEELFDDEEEDEVEESETSETIDICDACPCCMDETLEIMPAIKNIYFCDEPGKEKTIVIFADGTKVIKEMVPGDIFDLNIGVALCVAERMFGGKNQFHKMVKKVAGINKKK